MKIQNLQQKNRMLTVSQKVIIHTKIKFATKSIESSLCDYSDAYILVTENTTATPNNATTKVAFKNCAQLKIVEQKSMTLLLIVQILLILQCLCTI